VQSHFLRSIVKALCGCLFVSQALGNDIDQADTRKKLYAKRHLSAVEENDKREDFSATGIVGPFSNPDVGVGLVGVVGLFMNGKKTEPLFAYRPYNHRIIIGTYASTKGLFGAGINYDAPYLSGSLFRLRSMTEFSRAINENYFGSGSRTLDTASTLSRNGGKHYEKLDAFEESLQPVDATGQSAYKYNKFTLQRISNVTNLERDFFGGVIRGQTGFQISHYKVQDFSGRSIDVPGYSSTVISAATRLREDFEQGRVTGFSGGYSNCINFGLAFDTRDYEPNPTRGVFIDLAANLYTKYLGSTYDFQKVTLTPRFYFSPFGKLPIVIATRLMMLAHFGNAPFYELNRALPTDRQLNGIFGGRLSGRGFRQNRFVSPLVTTATFELRTTVARFSLWNQKLALMIAPFVDIGTVYDSFHAVAPATTILKAGYGGGLRVAWNQSTIILADLAFSKEDDGFYFYVEHTY